MKKSIIIRIVCIAGGNSHRARQNIAVVIAMCFIGITPIPVTSRKTLMPFLKVADYGD
jgi:hypothetical protein